MKMKKLTALFVSAALAAASMSVASAAPVNMSTSTLGAGELQVINYDPVWGDVDANVAKMSGIIEDASEAGVKMLVFPAMSTTGYMDEEDETTAYALAETADGAAASAIAALADELNMWVIYGGIEAGDGCIYNAAFACSPDGVVTTYEEINPTNSMFENGDYPVTIATEWGNVGLTVGNDTLNMPEITRYYAATDSSLLDYTSTALADAGKCGCGIIVGCLAYNEYYDYDTQDAEATEWVITNRMISTTSREGVVMAAANICGEENGEYFPGGSNLMYYGSCIAGGEEKEIEGSDGNNISTYDLYTGTAQTDIAYSNPSDINMSWLPGSTCKTQNDFHPDVYAKLYGELADKQEAGESFDYTLTEHGGPRVTMVNTNNEDWGNKKSGIENLEAYIIEAGEAGETDILVFPETVLTGYEYRADDFDWEDYNPLTGEVTESDGVTEMHLALAETVPGPTTEYLAEYAKKYNMYIVFGMTELDADGPMYESYYRFDQGDIVEKCYNSIAILAPDGSISSYQKEHRAGSECYWSVCGTNPTTYDFTVDGYTWTAGLHICRDGHFYPELGRYYVMSGAQMLLHPTATTGDALYRETRMGSYVSRDNVAAITVNTWGGDGRYDESTDSWTGGFFKSTSLIMTPDYLGEGTHDATGHPIEMYGTGTDAYSPEGLESGNQAMDLYGCGFEVGNLEFRTLSKMYDELATYMVDGYVSMYDDTTYPYTLSLTLKNTAGEELTAFPENSSFIAEVSVNETSESAETDYFIVAAYSESGELLSLQYAYADIPTDSTLAFGMTVPKSDTVVGSVKAFAWSGLSSMQALAKTITVSY